MREILFRGKRIDNGDWIEGYYVKTVDYRTDSAVHLIIELPSAFYPRGEIAEEYEINSSTIGQYTGLTDKNGKKIFEWDIVKTKFGRICKVIFFQSPCYCGIDLIPLEDKHKCPDKFDLYLSDNLEVIGNIYDNPELLGGESDG